YDCVEARVVVLQGFKIQRSRAPIILLFFSASQVIWLMAMSVDIPLRAWAGWMDQNSCHNIGVEILAMDRKMSASEGKRNRVFLRL
ncbi:MAG: hypothetical protein O7B27_14445, partial [Gammaproteobacteria bacterium]|nr:hypothetical protein [Gammaproteobacteria bacterium]